MSLTTIGRLLALFGFVSVAACTEEVARVESPSGRVEAVLVETNGGATTSFGYRIYLQPTRFAWGRRVHVASLYGATRSDCAYGVNLRWNGPNQLRARYRAAQSVDQKKVFATVATDTVGVLLEDGVTDSMAPCGGMYHAMQSR